MVERTRVLQFVAAVVDRNTTAAVCDFYHPYAVTTDGTEETDEDVTLACAPDIQAHRPETLLVQGDIAIIEWVFDIADQSGGTCRLHEISVQRWVGEKIAEERFFYEKSTIWSRRTGT